MLKQTRAFYKRIEAHRKAGNVIAIFDENKSAPYVDEHGLTWISKSEVIYPNGKSVSIKKEKKERAIIQICQCRDCSAVTFRKWRGTKAVASQCSKCNATKAAPLGGKQSAIKNAKKNRVLYKSRGMNGKGLTCSGCGFKFCLITGTKDFKKIRYCSPRCKSQSKTKIFGDHSLITIGTCFECGSAHVFKKGLNKRFCSDSCREISREKAAANVKKWKKLSPSNHFDRARKYGVKAEIGINAANVARRDGMICQVCKSEVEPHRGEGHQPKGWTVGHIIPMSKGGNHTWDNVQCECSECNSLKGDSIDHLEDYQAEA